MRVDQVVAAEPRSSRGKNEARRIRVTGRIPAVIYGAFQEPRAVSVNPKDILKIIRSKSGHNSIFDVDIEGLEKTPVIVADEQYHPVKGTLMHIDLKRIDLTKRLRVSVPIHTTGEAKGVKQQGGVLDVVTRRIEIECIPLDIPESLRSRRDRTDDRLQYPRFRAAGEGRDSHPDGSGSGDRARGGHQGRGCSDTWKRWLAAARLPNPKS